MNTHYFVVGKRYKCKHCEQQAKDIGSKLARQVGGGSVHGKVGNQTFGGYDRTTLTLFPHAKGERFPAVLSHKGGISKELLRWTTMLFDAGVRPHRLSTILLAQHTARHSDDYIQRESEIEKRRAANIGEPYLDGVLFSDFANPKLYAGAVPSGRSLHPQP
jgi:hypothetical protein